MTFNELKRNFAELSKINGQLQTHAINSDRKATSFEKLADNLKAQAVIQSDYIDQLILDKSRLIGRLLNRALEDDPHDTATPEAWEAWLRNPKVWEGKS